MNPVVVATGFFVFMASRTDHHDSIESLIQVGHEQGRPAPKSAIETRPPVAVPTKIKLTQADRAFAVWVKAGYDTCDYELINGPWYNRDSNERAELALNAGTQRWKFQKRIRVRDLARHRRSEITIRSTPVRRGIVRLRFDGDAHRGEPDARQVIERIARYFGPTLYIEMSERGCAGYAEIELPRLPWYGPIETSPNLDGTYFESARKLNDRLDALQATLVTLLKAEGFKASIEVNGRLEIRLPQKDDTGKIVNWKIVTRGRTAKLPRCRQDSDVPRLIASRFDWSIIERIIRDAPALGKITQPPTLDVAPAEPKSQLKRTASGCMTIRDTGDKNLNRWSCCREIALPLLGSVDEFSDIDEATQHRLIESANTIYESSGLNGGERDAARDRAFRQKFKAMFSGYDPEFGGKGHGGLWFDEDDDFRFAEQIVRSVVSKRELKMLRQTPKLRGPLTFPTIRMALVMIGKTCNNAARGHAMEDVPAKALIGFFRYFGIIVNGTFVRVVVDLLEAKNLLAINRSYRAGHYSRRMELRGAACRIPFLRHLYVETKVDPNDRALQQQAARYVRAGGAKNNNHISTQQQRIVYTVIDLSSDADLSEPAFLVSLDEIAKEYAERRREA